MFHPRNCIDRIAFSAIATSFLWLSANAAAQPAKLAQPRPGYSKVVVSKLLFKQPDASDSPSLWSGTDAQVIADYPNATVIYASAHTIPDLLARGSAARTAVVVRDDYDHILINGRKIDARLGLDQALRESSDPPYAREEFGTWIVQFAGPIKDEWAAGLESAGASLIQYVPYNAAIVSGRTADILTRVRELPYIQFVEQLHRPFKPSLTRPGGTKIEVWVQLAVSPEVTETVALLEKMSEAGVLSGLWSPVELRVEGVFRAEDLEVIRGQPHVIAIAERPLIALSDERVAVSLTGNNGVGAKAYKKWLSDTCESCSNLAGAGYYIGIADIGIAGGFFANPNPNPSIGDPPSSGEAHSALAMTRLQAGAFLGDSTGVFNPNGPWPDSTGSLHDVRSHGTMVASVAAGDSAVGEDGQGYLHGVGVAPSAGLVVTKINDLRITDRLHQNPLAVAAVTADALDHPPRIAYIQNHSYNQYQSSNLGCDEYWNGSYPILSRDFDAAVRDASLQTPGLQPITLTVSSGNVDQQGTAGPDYISGCPDQPFWTVPPATAKNVIAVGMAENSRPEDSASWNCGGALATSYANIGSNSSLGTRHTGWYKPDLLAPATNVAVGESPDTIKTPEDYCRSGLADPVPSLSDGYYASTGTSFAAPVAAGAALLASRYFAKWLEPDGGPASASPALLKAMLVAGARSMKGGFDRSRVKAWRPGTYYAPGARVIPTNPNPTGGRVYEANVPGCSRGTEPIWAGSTVTETGPPTSCVGAVVSWTDVGPEATIAAVPNGRQGFGRISLDEVLSSYPARDLRNGPELSALSEWTANYRVHDAGYPVNIALAWTDLPNPVSNGVVEHNPPLMNDLNLSVEIGVPCTSRLTGNIINSATEMSSSDSTCAQTQAFDSLNNVEIARFTAPAGTRFTVRVQRTQGLGGQDFGLVVFNAYEGENPPLGVPANLSATARMPTGVDVTWSAASGTGVVYDVQRSAGIRAPYVTIAPGITGTTWTDQFVSGDAAYLYRVRARNSTPVASYSNVDIATTMVFDDDPIVPGTTVVRAAHVLQLRQAIGYLRAAAGLGSYGWSDAVIVPMVTTVRATHVTDLRTALDQAKAALSLAPTVYGDSSVFAGSLIKAQHIQELRDALR